jgi:hypothetical protein
MPARVVQAQTVVTNARDLFTIMEANAVLVLQTVQLVIVNSCACLVYLTVWLSLGDSVNLVLM